MAQYLSSAQLAIGRRTDRFQDHASAALFRGFTDLEEENSTVVEDTSPNLTVTKSYDKLSLLHPGGDTTAEFHGVVWPFAPSGDFYIEGAWYGYFTSGNYYHMGIAASSGASYGSDNQMFLVHQSNSNFLQRLYWSNWSAVSVSANLATPQLYRQTPIVHFRMSYDISLTTWTYYVSSDGISWVNLGTHSQSLTTSHVGFCISSYTLSGPAVMTCEYFAAYEGLPT